MPIIRSHQPAILTRPLNPTFYAVGQITDHRTNQVDPDTIMPLPSQQAQSDFLRHLQQVEPKSKFVAIIREPITRCGYCDEPLRVTDRQAYARHRASHLASPSNCNV